MLPQSVLTAKERLETIQRFRIEAVESLEQIQTLQIREAARRWEFLRLMHEPSRLEKRIAHVSTEFYSSSSADMRARLQTSVRNHVTAGPICDHIKRINKYGSKIYHHALAYEWDGKRICYTHVDTNSDAHYDGYGLWSDIHFSAELLGDAEEPRVSVYAFWKTDAPAPTSTSAFATATATATELEPKPEPNPDCSNFIPQTIDRKAATSALKNRREWSQWLDVLEKRLQTSQHCRTLEKLLEDIPECLWLLVLCMSAQDGGETGTLGWMLCEELLAKPSMFYYDSHEFESDTAYMQKSDGTSEESEEETDETDEADEDREAKATSVPAIT